MSYDSPAYGISNLDRVAEYIYVALSAKWCHAKLISKDLRKEVIISKHRFHVRGYLSDSDNTYKFKLSALLPDPEEGMIINIEKAISIDMLKQSLLNDHQKIAMLIQYFDTELSTKFIHPESTTMTKLLYSKEDLE